MKVCFVICNDDVLAGITLFILLPKISLYKCICINIYENLNVEPIVLVFSKLPMKNKRKINEIKVKIMSAFDF